MTALTILSFLSTTPVALSFTYPHTFIFTIPHGYTLCGNECHFSLHSFEDDRNINPLWRLLVPCTSIYKMLGVYLSLPSSWQPACISQKRKETKIFCCSCYSAHTQHSEPPPDHISFHWYQISLCFQFLKQCVYLAPNKEYQDPHI